LYNNPKNTKQEIKLFAFYLLDIGIVAAMLMIAVYVNKVLPLTGWMQIFYYLISVIFGVFLCVKTPSHPTERNFQILLRIFRMDRNKYHAVDTKNFE